MLANKAQMSRFWKKFFGKKSEKASISPTVLPSTSPTILASIPPTILTSPPKTLPSLANEPGANKLQAKCHRFRILIIGRANSGKTTILQRTCNTTGNPVVYNPQGEKMDSTVLKSSTSRGIHDIEDEMIFESNPSFCFHDSRGFEAGGIDELEKVKTFIEKRSKERTLSRQIHAIWYCIPVDDSRPFTTAENRFFSECGTGKVPVIAIFTKFDALRNKVFGALVAKGESMGEAIRLAPEKAIRDFESLYCKILYAQTYPPKGHVYLPDMNRKGADCNQLIERTAGALDNEVLKQLFVSAQRNSLALCMEYAIDRCTERTRRLNEEGQKSLGPKEFKQVIYRALGWFPQHTVRTRFILEQHAD